MEVPAFLDALDLGLIGPREEPIGSRPSSFAPKFKARAIDLYRSSEGRTIADVARQLGIGTETFRKWVRQDDADRGERDDQARRARQIGARVGPWSPLWRLDADDNRAMAPLLLRLAGAAIRSDSRPGRHVPPAAAYVVCPPSPPAWGTPQLLDRYTSQASLGGG
jgi:transposase-like protein